LYQRTAEPRGLPLGHRVVLGQTMKNVGRRNPRLLVVDYSVDWLLQNTGTAIQALLTCA